MDQQILNQLYAVIRQRKYQATENSYTASLYRQGTAHIAQKLGEEAIETVIEAVAGNPQAVIEESADLLYHLLVLWSDQDITPEQVLTVLSKRFGKSGLDEKKLRPLA